MIPERYKELVKKLSQRTNDGEVSWKSTPNEKTFVVDFREFSLSIDSYYSRRDSSEYVNFQILDSDGEVVDYFGVSEGESEWFLSHELYSEARRKAHGIDLVIGDITKELESEGLVGEEDISSESED